LNFEFLIVNFEANGYFVKYALLSRILTLRKVKNGEANMPRFEFRSKSYNNPVELALEIIGGKWKMPILWRLQEKPWRYGELKKGLRQITRKMLTEQLRELESDGLIHREVYQVVPPKVEYSVTPKGETAIPIIERLRESGVAFRDEKLEASRKNTKPQLRHAVPSR
jgi:DNA-binding HxlR family transcriptional regulator